MSLQQPFTPIPRCLSMALGVFQGASKSTMRILPEKTTYVDGETAVFSIPQGTFDGWNASLGMNFNITTAAVNVTASLPFGAAAVIKRMELTSGSGTIYGSGAANDWSTAWVYRHALAQPGYQAASSRKAYEYPSVQYAAIGTYTLPAIIPEVHALCFKNLRMLPTSAFPGQLQLKLTLDMASRIAPTANLTFNSLTPVLYMQKYNFPQSLSPEMVLERALESGVFQIAQEQFIVQQSSSQTSGTVNFSLATNSLDYLMYIFKSPSITNANFFFSQYPTGATLNFDVNSVPTSNWSIQNTAEAYMYTLQNLDGGWNIAVDPQMSIADYTGTIASNSKFIIVERFCLPKNSIEDASVSGLSTLGSTIPMHMNVQGSTSLLTPVGIAVVTSLIQLAAGRQCAVLM